MFTKSLFLLISLNSCSFLYTMHDFHAHFTSLTDSEIHYVVHSCLLSRSSTESHIRAAQHFSHDMYPGEKNETSVAHEHYFIQVCEQPLSTLWKTKNSVVAEAVTTKLNSLLGGVDDLKAKIILSRLAPIIKGIKG